MSTFEILNNKSHCDLKIRMGVQSSHPFAQVVLTELASATMLCPVMLTKEPDSGDFFLCAVLSLKPGEAPLVKVTNPKVFLPLSHQCSGFYIHGEHIAIDKDHPRFSSEEGEMLFNDAGQASSILRGIQTNIWAWQNGLDLTRKFIAQMLSFDLVESVDIDLRFDDAERLQLNGLYSISLDRLTALDDNSILELHHAGFLNAAYLLANSVKQFSVLAEIRNQNIAIDSTSND